MLMNINTCCTTVIKYVSIVKSMVIQKWLIRCVLLIPVVEVTQIIELWTMSKYTLLNPTKTLILTGIEEWVMYACVLIFKLPVQTLADNIFCFSHLIYYYVT